MIVQLKQSVPDTLQKEYTKQLLHLKKNKQYVVLGVSLDKFRVVNEGGNPTLFLRVLFDIVDDCIDNDWVIKTGKYNEKYPDEFDTGIYMSPKEFKTPGFYFQYLFDYDPKTVNIFLEYITKHNIISVADLAYAPKFRKEYYKILLKKIDDYCPVCLPPPF
ncbi:MAG: Unknown protein [uncultured Sulfurovum sp.]|uniref:Uncharacterized protein n=1 Tax=uncultured Sulfurovum sp. TaxID=269237 RepID=A0A6S6U4S2_9BACT|nr:MAG: Unknown protein [uncultured Sulfurovum sp.]